MHHPQGICYFAVCHVQGKREQLQQQLWFMKALQLLLIKVVIINDLSNSVNSSNAA